jgi:CheY-like chemotaxis protein
VVSLDVNDVVHRTVQLIEYEVRLRQIELVTELTPEPAVVRADRLQLQQVLVNLLTNAVHAVGGNPPDRPRRVTVRTSRREARVAMEVEDTGPGVPDALVRQIFTPFFTTKEPGEGTGLGLAISFSLIERSGGTLEVHRGAQGGALFRAELPSAQLSGEHRLDRAFSGHQPKPGPAGGPEFQVLLVDGDPAVRQMIAVLLSDDGHAVEAAQDPAQALQLLERRQWDLVIADPRAAVSAGEPFADVLLARWPALKTRTIFATADVRPETEDWLKRLGCRYFLKPVNARQLRAAAAELLHP